ncbi:hypothetical protein ACIGO9_30150 [Nocardia asteroides]|uniref:hypothetical protein n=1 Tax=Nocardia asteroides TaxID=1824 RepID=UPI0037CBAA52
MTFPPPTATVLPGYPGGDGGLAEHVDALNAAIERYRSYQDSVLEALRADAVVPRLAAVTARPPHEADRWFWAMLDEVWADPRLNAVHCEQATDALFSAHLSEENVAVIASPTRWQRLRAAARTTLAALSRTTTEGVPATTVMAPHKYPGFA